MSKLINGPDSYFISPAAGTANPPPWSQNAVYPLGSTLNISWVTNETSFAISLGQQYSLALNEYSLDSGAPIFDSATSDPSTRSFIWTVSTSSFSLNTSTAYYLQIGLRDNAYEDAATSQYFNISEPVSKGTGTTTSASGAGAVSTVTGVATAAASTGSSHGGGSSMSTAEKAGLGIGIGLGVPLLLSLFAIIIFRVRKRRRRHTSPKENGLAGDYDGEGAVLQVEAKTHELDGKGVGLRGDIAELDGRGRVAELEGDRKR